MHIAPMSPYQRWAFLAKRTTNLLNVHYLCVAEYIFLLPQAIVDTSQHCNGLAHT
jgi:hypothetical protein